MTDAPTSTAEIRDQVVRSLHQLENLREQGRIVLATDQYDPQWLDVTAATEAAIAALSRAAEALLVLDTQP